MNEVSFDEIVTETVMSQIEAESETYNGLYTDLSDADERRYVKDKASTIKDMVKKLDRAVIDKPAKYKALVKSTALPVRDRLLKANEPFTLLLDDWEVSRKVILDAEKASKLAIEKAAQKEIDHEFAILLDKSYLADKLAAEKSQLEHDERIRVKSEEDFKLSMIRAKQITDQAIELDKANRLASKEHVRGINRTILTSLMQAGIAEEDAKTVISLAAKRLAGNLTINY